jgi:PKHD-type hydroxylase
MIQFQPDTVHDYGFIDNLFTPEECAKIIQIGESKSLEQASISDNTKLSKFRNSQVSWLYERDIEFAAMRIAEAVISANAQLFQFDLFGLAEGIQFTRYDAPSGFYGMHIDKMVNNKVRKLSVTIQLSPPDTYDGGELALQFEAEPTIMPKELGKMIVFPSYVLHEVRPVTKGTRYSLVAWVAGKPFK